MIGTVRAILILGLVVVLTLLMLPVQLFLNRLPGAAKRRLPHLWHRLIAKAVGLRIKIIDEPSRLRPLLLVSNHVSWLDIIVLSAAFPVSFIAKSEVASWPGAGLLAKLQRTIFVERERRSKTGEKTKEIAKRLASGDVIVLFAEGTSTNGTSVLPFRSALLGAVLPNIKAQGKSMQVQPVALAYTGLLGLPTGFGDRVFTGFYGDMDLAPQLWSVLKTGGLDAAVSFGKAISVTPDTDRKELAKKLHQEVRAMKTALLRGNSGSGEEIWLNSLAP